jgi:hypothetical protein
MHCATYPSTSKKKRKFQTWYATAIFCKTHTLSCKMQIMLQISSMVLLQSTTTDEARFNDEHEMSVDDGLHGWTEDRNWWVRLMTWRRCRWGHQMTWTSKAWGPVVGPVFGHGRRESGVRWWGPSRWNSAGQSSLGGI